MITNEMKSHFMNMYHMVLADDTVKPEELVRLYEIGKRHGVSEEDFNNLLGKPVDFVVPDGLNKKITCLYELVEIILADGEIDDNEVVTLKRYCVRFGFDPNNANDIANYLINSVKEGKTIENIINEIKEEL